MYSHNLTCTFHAKTLSSAWLRQVQLNVTYSGVGAGDAGDAVIRLKIVNRLKVSFRLPETMVKGQFQVFGQPKTDFQPVNSLTDYWSSLAFSSVTSFFCVFLENDKTHLQSAPIFFFFFSSGFRRKH